MRGFANAKLGLWFGLGLMVAQSLAVPAPAADQPSARPADLPPGYGEVQVIVLGVTAPFFVFGIVKRFEQIPGVEHASFNLLHGIADIILKPGASVTDDDLRRAVRNASYSIGPIHWIIHPVADAAGK